LVELGHTVVIAENGDRGIALAHIENPDLILMDASVARRDGLKATQLLKSDLQTWRIPIVVLSNDASNREIAFSAGCTAYMIKPVAFGELKSMINTLLAANVALIRK
jgi:two-component system cell cycle response regulator/putative two-component system response regulator